MESAVTNQKRLAHIDLLKCLAMYFVLLFHGTLYNNLVLPGMSVGHVLRYFSRTILSTCVPLFFFANGYLLLSRPLSLKRHSIKTVRLMLVTCFWMVFLLVVLQPYYGEYHTWEYLKNSWWELRDGWNNQLWYMGVLIGIYFVFPVLKRTFDADKGAFYWFTGVVIFLTFGDNLLNLAVTIFDVVVKHSFYLYDNQLPVFQMFNPFGYLFGMGLGYFCLGGVACALEERILRIPSRWRNLAAGLGLAVCCFLLGMICWRFSLYRKYILDVVWFGYFTVFTLGSVVCLYVLTLNYRGENRLIRLIAANTLGIYFVHDIFHKILGTVAVQFTFMQTLPGTIVHAAVLMLVSLGVCLVLKKLPILKYLV